MQCPRCAVKMISSQRQEQEFLGKYMIVKIISTRECPSCSVEIIAVLPTLFQKEKLT
jgi:hypothetical protein